MKLVLLVGPPGCGKSTYSTKYVRNGYTYVSQDLQGKEGHLNLFLEAINSKMDIVVDRMNFNKIQRDRYLVPAKELGYETEIVVIHESKQTCANRMKNRIGHPTIADEKSASQALNMFFSKYERVQDSEADHVARLYPEGDKPRYVVCDLDGTMCNIDHRLHYIQNGGKKDWTSFYSKIKEDTVNEWCQDIVQSMSDLCYGIVYCSGRPDTYEKDTREWIDEKNLPINHLFMRPRNDFRPDYVVKEVILDFELLTRFDIYFIMDDRRQVVDLWRRRGFTCLQVAEGEF